jgi:hypothetical protein
MHVQRLVKVNTPSNEEFVEVPLCEMVVKHLGERMRLITDAIPRGTPHVEFRGVRLASLDHGTSLYSCGGLLARVRSDADDVRVWVVPAAR